MPSTQSLRTRAFILLCASWFFVTAALGVFYPYFALFLRENVGLRASVVGVLIAVPPVAGLLAQPLWGQLADRSGSRIGVLVALCLGTALGYVLLSGARDLYGTTIATIVLAMFLSALFPLLFSVSFAVLGSPFHFGRVRVWGTIGYMLVVVGLPPLLHAVRGARGIERVPGGPSEPGLELCFYLAALLTLLGAAAVMALPRNAGVTVKAQRGDLRALLREPAFVRVLVFSAGIQFFLNGPMVLFPLYVRSRGGSMTDLSHLWLCMLAFEVPMIFLSGSLFRKLGVTRVISLAAAAGGLRWTVCALVPTLALAVPVQALHALVVTGLSVGTAQYVEQIVPARLRASAQSTLVMAGSSLGGVLSSTLGGYLVDHAGIDALFLFGGLGAIAWAAWSRRWLLSAEAVSSPREQPA